MDNIVFFYIKLINHLTYIELSCYLIKTPNNVEIFHHYNILKTMAKLLVFYCLPYLKIVMDTQTFKSVYLCMYTNRVPTLTTKLLKMIQNWIITSVLYYVHTMVN